MLKLIVTCGLLTASTVACSSASSAAEDQVRNELTDPESAQFRSVVEKGDFVCGEVNAKNMMGGYNGFRRFYVEGRGKGGAIVDPQAWASRDAREMFGEAILSPSIDTKAFEAVYFRVCELEPQPSDQMLSNELNIE